MPHMPHGLSFWSAAALLAASSYASPALAGFYNGPYVQHIQENSALLMWETDADSTGTVQYGTTTAYGQVVTEGTSDTLHSVELSNLTANTTYYYSITESSGSSRTGSFSTAVKPGTDFTFAAYGDNRSNPDDHAAVASAVLSHSPRFVVTTGDYIEDAGNLNQWHDQFFVPAAQLLSKTPLIPAIGNHDTTMGHPTSPVWDYFPRPGDTNYYSWDYGDIHFVVVDSNLRYGKLSPQYQWLENDLASTTKSVIIVMHHFPVYSSGNHGSAPMMDNSLRPLYEQYGVAAVLNGHDHMYERSVRNGINYFVLGGGGADLYTPGDNPNQYAVTSEKTHNFGVFDWRKGNLTMTAYRPDDSVIETVTLYSSSAAARVAVSLSDEAVAADHEDTESAGCGLGADESIYAQAGGGVASLMAVAGLALIRRRR